MTRKTSIDAYNEIKRLGLLPERRWEVYDLLYRKGPLTAKAAWLMLAPRSATGVIATRFSELCRQGAIEVVGDTIDPGSKFKATLWDVTGRLPAKLAPKTARSRGTAGEGSEIETLKKDNEQLRTMLRLLNTRYKKLMAKLYPVDATAASG